MRWGPAEYDNITVMRVLYADIWNVDYVSVQGSTMVVDKDNGCEPSPTRAAYDKLELLFPLLFIRLLNNVHDYVKAIPILLHITFIVLFLETFKDLSLHLVKLRWL